MKRARRTTRPSTPAPKLTRVAIHGVPRSGTSWIGEIVNSSPHTAYRYQPLFSYAHKSCLNGDSSREDIDRFFSRLIRCDDGFTNQITKRLSGDLPRFKKTRITHVAYKEVRYMNILFNLMEKTDDVRLCAVIRNPLSTISSWLRTPREFRRDLGWSALEEWRYAGKKNLNLSEEFNGYEKWKEAAHTFLDLKKAHGDRVHVIVYADILRSPGPETERLFEFLELPMTAQTKDFLRDSTTSEKNGSYSVFRKHQSDEKWKADLPAEISRQIQEDLKGTDLERFLR